MSETKEKEIREALRKVIDPEIGMDVVTLGMIRQINVDEEGNAEIKMVLTAPFCPLASYLTEQVRMTTAQVEGIKNAKVTLLDERWDPSWMEKPPQ